MNQRHMGYIPWKDTLKFESELGKGIGGGGAVSAHPEASSASQRHSAAPHTSLYLGTPQICTPQGPDAAHSKHDSG